MNGPMPRGCGAPAAVAGFPANRARNQTVRTSVRPSVTGDAVKVRLSNRFGDAPLSIAHVTAAHPAGTGAVSGGRDVLFGGRRVVTIAPGAEVLSDAVAVRADRDHDLVVSIAIVTSGVLTWHVYADTDGFTTSPGTGDHAGDSGARAFTRRLSSYVVLTGMQVHAPSSTRVVAAFGDSITDGGGAAPRRRWIDVLGRRLRGTGVLNAGIACNSLTAAGLDSGPKAPDRLQRDVLDRAGVTEVIVFEGTNDVYGGVTADNVIAALTDLAATLRAAGKRVIGATLLPRQDAPSPSRNVVRRNVNDWIRTTKVFDGVIDFDAVIRSPTNQDNFKPAYLGDDIHPSAAGHVAMGNAVSLRLFSR